MNGADFYVRFITLFGAAGALAAGAWAFLFPASFFDAVAPYPPFSSHFVRDAGAAATGFSAMLVLAIRSKDPIAVALGALAVGSLFHALSHLIDIDTRPADFVGLTVFACLVMYGLVRRVRAVRASWTRSKCR